MQPISNRVKRGLGQELSENRNSHLRPEYFVTSDQNIQKCNVVQIYALEKQPVGTINVKKEKRKVSVIKFHVCPSLITRLLIVLFSF